MNCPIFKYVSTDDFTVKDSQSKLFKPLKMFYRPETSDRAMLKECMTNYNCIEIGPKDVVMDFGANVGGFSKMALDAGANEVISVEADELNYEVLNANIGAHPNSTLLRKAVVGDNRTEVSFAIRKSKNSACAGKVASEKECSYSRYQVNTVPAVNFAELLEEHNPTILKIDIEGGEYDILRDPLPKSVHTIALELHGMTKIGYAQMLATYAALSEHWDILYYGPHLLFDKLQLLNIIFTRREDGNESFDKLHDGSVKINPDMKKLQRGEDISPEAVYEHAMEYLNG